MKPVREAFVSSYRAGKRKNQFTKVQMSVRADLVLLEYFVENIASIERWFNIISPEKKTLAILQDELKELKNKNWANILP